SERGGASAMQLQQIDTFLLAHRRLPTTCIVIGCLVLFFGFANENDKIEAKARRERQAAAAEREARERRQNDGGKPHYGTIPDPRASLSRLSFETQDPHICEKSEDAYYAAPGQFWGAKQEGTFYRGLPPEFLFNTRH